MNHPIHKKNLAAVERAMVATGPLGQAFILEAIAKYAEQVETAPEGFMANTMIHEASWRQTAQRVRQTITDHLDPNTPNPVEVEDGLREAEMDGLLDEGDQGSLMSFLKARTEAHGDDYPDATNALWRIMRDRDATTADVKVAMDEVEDRMTTVETIMGEPDVDRDQYEAETAQLERFHAGLSSLL